MGVKRITTVLLALVILSGFTFIGIKDAVKTSDNLELQKIELNSKSTEIKQLNVQYEKLNQQLDNASTQKNVSEEEYKRLQDEKVKVDKEREELRKQLQSKIDSKSKLAEASDQVIKTATATETASAATTSSIDCSYPATAKAFIYCKESTNTAHKYNSIGCYGLGQDCNGIVEKQCGADYACQDDFFTNYMLRRYGSWEKAKAFWQARVPINGKDVGNWW